MIGSRPGDVPCWPAPHGPRGRTSFPVKFRDSRYLNQAMDSRLRGNEVISARRVAFSLAVIPAQAEIHFGQRISKLEIPRHRRSRLGANGGSDR